MAVPSSKGAARPDDRADPAAQQDQATEDERVCRDHPAQPGGGDPSAESLARPWAPWWPPGCPPGCYSWGFALVVLVAAVSTWRGHPGPAGDRGAGPPGVRVIIAGFVVGVLAGLFGVGGGFLAVPAQVFAVRLDMATAVGTSLAVIAANSATALVTHLDAGAPDWAVVAPFAGAAVAGALAGRLPARRASGVVCGALSRSCWSLWAGSSS